MLVEPNEEMIVKEIISLMKKFNKLNNQLELYPSIYYSIELKSLGKKLSGLLAMFYKDYKIPISFINERLYLESRTTNFYVSNRWALENYFSKKSRSNDELICLLFSKYLKQIVSNLKEKLKSLKERKQVMKKEKEKVVEILKPFLVLENL